MLTAVSKTPTPIESAEQLMTLPPGLYQLPGERPVRNFYDPLCDEFVDAMVHDIASVREKDEPAPIGLDLKVRPDGACVLFGSMVIPGTETYRGRLRLE